MSAVLTGWFLALAALPLLGGGVRLAMLGGSWGYVALGAALLAAGVLLALRRRQALWVYALLMLGVLGWALWEAGLDRWALVPRGALLSVVGLWLLTPWIERALAASRGGAAAGTPAGTPAVRWPAPRAALGAVMLLVVAVATGSLLDDALEVRQPLPRADAHAAAAPGPTAGPPPAGDDWPAYGGSAYGQRYSSLAAITPATIGGLKHAWTFHTGDLPGEGDPQESTFELTPLKVGDLLYLCTPHSIAIALDAATGQERWRFDPQVEVGKTRQHLTCRGLAYHEDEATPDAPCARRLFLPTIDARLIALDAATGERCAGFADDGVLNLAVNMPNLRPGAYMLTSPPAVTRDLVIVGAAINDNERTQDPSGVIRAFDVHTGRLIWNWDPVKPEDTAPLPAGRQYSAGGPNMWSVASVDEALGLVYLPIANRSPDLLGDERGPNVERVTSSVVALDLATGRVRWVFQTVHHDLWDRDVPSQPTLVDLTIDGARVPALVAPTKQGELFVLDRRTGEPLLPVGDVEAPASPMPDATAAPEQPQSSLSFMPPPLREADMWGATPWDQLLCRIRFRSLRYEGPWTPPSTDRSLVYPGNTGVFNWGGVAVDPVREVLLASPVRLAFTHKLVPRTDPRERLVTEGEDAEPWNENFGGRYAFELGPFTSPLGIPCQQPPWGLLSGADLRTGEHAWLRRNGTVRDHMPLVPIPFAMGVPSLGGPLVTAGGVMFYSGTLDNALRAYDVTTGRLLWQARLPAGGQATPMTYRAGGRQMVVVAAGGHGSFGTTLGDAVVAFALDRPGDDR